MRASVLLLATLLSVLSLCPVVLGGTPFPYSWETRWWSAQIDNFNFASSGQTFQLKYLINQQFYKEGGPIFFYTGNEGPIELFANNTGFMWDIAPEFNALLVFAEHRYYGASLPFGADSFTNENYVHLSAEQALADYAQFLGSLKKNMSIPDAEVISFGGSYGGMLTSWFRAKYPHVVSGAIAGSAPIWFFDTLRGEFDAGSYSRIASNDFKAVSQNCFDNIAASWSAMVEVASGTDGLKTISDELGLCATIDSADNVTNTIWPWASNVYSTLPMGDYPYAATFLGPLPAYPVNVTCGYWSADKMSSLELVRATRQTMDLFYNGTGQAGSCHNISSEQGVATLGAGTQWSYQSCSEMVMPIGQYGPPNDLFYPAPWNLTATIASCQEQFGVTPKPTWITTQFGGPGEWASATNIVFSNGNLDPWSGGGVLDTISSTLIALEVEGGAHHLDLRASNPNDPPGVVAAREQEVAYIRTFLADPSPASNSQSGGLTKAQVAFISACSTAVALVLGFLAYKHCSKKQEPETVALSANYSEL